jgi:hypothetical protein
VTKVKEGVPFVLKDAHHGGIESGGIARAKWHDSERILFMMGAKERKFRLVLGTDGNLMVTGFVIKADKVETACRVAEVIDGVVAAGDRVFEREGDLVQAAV